MPARKPCARPGTRVWQVLRLPGRSRVEGDRQVRGKSRSETCGHALKRTRRIVCSPRMTPGTAADKARLAPFVSPSSRPGVMQEPVLVLNATFEPINVTAVRRAMVLLLKGVAQAEELNHAEVHSATKALKVPSVIRL